ncbi:MAG: hypothetical protein ACYCZX_11660 [Rhodospirillaceae bacterium]
MYTVYREQPSRALRWVADLPTEERARALASLQSKHSPQPVVIVRRFDDDGTGVVATFRGGIALSPLE